MNLNTSYLITVCIVHFRKLKQLKNTIDYLLKNTVSKVKIKILNQGYLDDDIKVFYESLKIYDNIEIIYSAKNVGCSPGRNILTRNIDTPYIMILDDDMYVSKNWDVPVIKYFSNHPEIGAIGFSIYKTNGDFWFAGGQNIIIKNGQIFNNRINYDPTTTKEEFVIVDDVCAGAMVYRKEIKELMHWDTNYFIGFEDLEKGIYLKRSDWRCAISLKSHFIHNKVSVQTGYKEYNQSRRDYHAMRKAYIHFIKKNKLRWDFKHHFFYKYVCLLPSSYIRLFVFSWLFIKDKIIR